MINYGAATLSIMTFSIIKFSITIKKIVKLKIITLSIMALDTECFYAMSFLQNVVYAECQK